MTIYDYLKQKIDLTELFDSHCHLNSAVFDKDREEIVTDFGAKYIFDVAVDIETSLKALSNCNKYDAVRAFIGIDPEIFIPGSELFKNFEQNDQWFTSLKNKLHTLIDQNQNVVLGIGETGLDFYRFGNFSKEIIKNSVEKQEKLFRIHLELAEKKSLMLTIHSRGAEKRALEIASEYKVTGIFHSYTGDYETAKTILDKGFGLGINGIITFKNANSLREIYKKIIGRIPKELSPEFLYKKNLFLETDAPYLAPDGKRGERNVPKNIYGIFKFIEKFYS